MRRIIRISAALAVLAAAELHAQGDCFPPTDSHEAKTLAVMSLPLVFSAAHAPMRAARTVLYAGVDGSSVPSPDSVTRTPTLCRPGKGPERTDLIAAVPRPRIALALASGTTFELSWIPPLALAGVKANLIGLAAGQTVRIGRALLLGVRAHGTFGLVRAPVTCNTDALSDPASECFNGTRSSDRFHPNIFGVDGSLGWALAGGRLRPYVGGGYNVLHPRFQVNFTNSQGTTDNRKVEVDLGRGTAFGGITWAPSGMWDVGAEVYTALGDAVTARVAVRTGFGL